MMLINKLKTYKYAILIVVSVLLIIVAAFARILNKDVLTKAFGFFHKNMQRYLKRRNAVDKKAFEDIEKIDKRKDEIKKQIDGIYKENKDKITKEHKDTVKAELESLHHDNEQELENWYRDFLNTTVSNNGNK